MYNVRIPEPAVTREEWLAILSEEIFNRAIVQAEQHAQRTEVVAVPE